jgi:hypothetical protein
MQVPKRLLRDIFRFEPIRFPFFTDNKFSHGLSSHILFVSAFSKCHRAFHAALVAIHNIKASFIGSTCVIPAQLLIHALLTDGLHRTTVQADATTGQAAWLFCKQTYVPSRSHAYRRERISHRSFILHEWRPPANGPFTL